MAQSQKVDALVIGFGKGGKTLAAYMGRQGMKVALVEQSEKMYGGTCINIACIPTKSLVVSAERKVPYTNAIATKDELTAFLRKKNFSMVNDTPNAHVYTGKASFVSAQEVKVVLHDTKEEILFTPAKIFINTGTTPNVPSIKGLERSRIVYTSTSLQDRKELPEKLVIIGAGFIGLEYASMYAQFGSAVTVLNNGPVFLPGEDDDIREAVITVLENKGIRILSGMMTEEIITTGDVGISTVICRNAAGNTVKLDANAILLATGRVPATDGLNLAAAGIETDARGFIKTDAFLRTNVSHIWAVGDINGGPQFTYISLDDFRIIKDQLSGSSQRSVADRKYVSSTTFITPPLSHVGLREKEAREKGLAVKVARLPAAAIPRARILQETEGLLKAVVAADTGRILGCTLFCAASVEMINLVQLAMQADVPYTTLRDAIYTHPSMTEAFNDLFGAIK
ncbi:FAD-dependent oxidoreductase [Chitinophaga sp. MM2321]|uniref:FAD-dependent oxidoreductase n=1 Tax=Chitinophaga sp. MM2321 TaxID=3137178 RepID=UPI0032D599DA